MTTPHVPTTDRRTRSLRPAPAADRPRRVPITDGARIPAVWRTSGAVAVAGARGQGCGGRA
ncbi:hypothetical protein ACWDTR_19605 [Streptomyces sp. NPDC003470]|uniref:hypothetical protein n=1 Tax=Streptomyces sp. NPDC059701 TaxID=3346914 RepID=UPI0036BE2EC7